MNTKVTFKLKFTKKGIISSTHLRGVMEDEEHRSIPQETVRAHNAPWEREFLPQIMTALQESGMAVAQWHLGVLHLPIYN